MADTSRKSPLTPREDASLEAIAAALHPLVARVDALEQRKNLVPKGIWHPDALYEEGDAATDRGSLWICTRRTRAQPGSDGSWTLAVKSARA